MREQHVAFCCSGEHTLHFLAAAGRSLLDHHPQTSALRFHVVYEHWSPTTLERIETSWNPARISFYRLSDYLGTRALEPEYGYWFRTWLYLLLPKEIDQVLYLDCDVLVMRDISPLWDIDLNGYLAAMVEDPFSPILAENLSGYAEKLGLSYELPNRYYNSGMILMNLARWRDLDAGRVLHERFADLRPHPWFHDQTEINLLFSGEILPLSPTWNLVEHFWLYDCWNFELYESVGKPRDYFTPRIFHFAGERKVTARWRRWGLKKAFYRSLDKTAWKGWRAKNDTTLGGKQLALLLELHYLLIRRRVLPNFWPRLGRLLAANPVLPLIYLVIVPLNRLKLRLQSHSRAT